MARPPLAEDVLMYRLGSDADAPGELGLGHGMLREIPPERVASVLYSCHYGKNINKSFSACQGGNATFRNISYLFVKWLKKCCLRAYLGEELRVLGKGNKRRVIPLNAAALDVILRQPKGGEYVFAISNRHQPDLFRRTVMRLRKLSGVGDFHLHLLRHRFATDLIRAGVDIVTTSALLGHSAAMTTLLYAHPSAESKKRAVLALLSPDHPSTRT